MTEPTNMTCLCRASSRIDTDSVHTDGAHCPYTTDEPLATLCPYSAIGGPHMTNRIDHPNQAGRIPGIEPLGANDD